MFCIQKGRGSALVRTRLRKLKHIHIIPLTGTKLLPRTAEEVLSIPGHTLGAHRAEIHSDSDSALHRFPAVRFPKTRGAIGMKTTLLAIVLAVAFAAAAQAAPQTQPAAPAAAQAQRPAIKEGAQYTAYVGAVQHTDPKATVTPPEPFPAPDPARAWSA